jgi:hypothetical protein
VDMASRLRRAVAADRMARSGRNDHATHLRDVLAVERSVSEPDGYKSCLAYPGCAAFDNTGGVESFKRALKVLSL